MIDIYTAVGQHHQPAAEHILSRLEDRVLQLRQHPRLGPGRDEIKPGIRALVVGAYIVFYRNTPDADEGPVDMVEVLRVLDGRRALSRLV
ncbi:type II toxin-antitoxin system RelE/ParE family toxin [Zavarzinia compransoris]|nr:type II toxin-antitoxin system RelE/ParE family toxin [Zavarzinia marina]